MSTILWLLLTAGAVQGVLNPSPFAPRTLEVLDANSDSSSLSFVFRMHFDSSIVPGGFLTIIFPAELSMKATSGPVCTIQYLRTYVSSACSYSSQVLSVTLDDAVSSNSTLVLRARPFDPAKYAGGTGQFIVYSQNYSSGQAKDVDYQFGQVGFLPPPAAIDPLRTSFTPTSALVNATTDYTVEFFPVLDIYSGSEFRLTLPSTEWQGLLVSGPCSVTARDYKVSGNFYCYMDPWSTLPSIRLAGLINDIPAGSDVLVKFQNVRNPVCIVTAGNVVFDVVGGGTYASRQRVTVASFTPISGTLKDVSQSPYNSYASFYLNNFVLDSLSFTIITGIPAGGQITINYNVLAGQFDTTDSSYVGCYLQSAEFYVNAASPSCVLNTPAGTASITGLPAIPGGTTLVVVVRLSLTTAPITYPVIQTMRGDKCVIDQNNNHIGGITPSPAATSPVSTSTYTVMTGQDTMSFTTRFSNTVSFNIGQVLINLPPLWRPYSAERVYCTYTINTLIPTTVNIPQELCVFDTADNTITWTPITAVTLPLGISIQLSFGHRLVNPNQVYSWRPIVASSISTYHEFALRFYNSGQTLTYAYHVLPKVLPLDSGKSVFSAPKGFPSDLYAPVTVTPFLAFDSIPIAASMQTFIEVRFYTTSNWLSDLGSGISTSVRPFSLCQILLPLQSLASGAPYQCELLKGTPYATVRVWNIGPLRKYLSPSISIVTKGPTSVLNNMRVDVGYGYLHNTVFNYHQMDQISLDLTTVAATVTASTWNIIPRATTDLICQKPTFITINTFPVTTGNTALVLNFPGGWQFNKVSLRSRTSLCSSPTVYNGSYIAVLVCTLFTVTSTDPNVAIQLLNQNYTGQGVDIIKVLYYGGSSDPNYFNSVGNLESCLKDTVSTTAATIPQQISAVGSAIFLHYDLPGTYATTDRVQLSFPGALFTNAVCTPSTSAASCTQDSKTASIFWIKVSTGTLNDVGSVQIKQTLLPSASPFTFTVNVCYGSVDCSSMSASGTGSVVLPSPSYSGDLLISKVELYPNNRLTNSHLHIQMAGSQSIPSRSLITLTASFAWPTPTPFNYLFSHDYRSVSVNTNTLTINVGRRIPAREFMELELFYVNLGAAGATQTWELVTGTVSYYGGYQYLASPAIAASQTLLPTPTHTSNFVISGISLDYTNNGESAIYTFTVSNPITTATSYLVDTLRIRFPSGYALPLGVTCQVTELAINSCTVMNDRVSVLLPYGQTLSNTQVFNVQIAGVVNPPSSAGGFTIASLYNQTLLDESLSTTSTTLTFTSAPQVLDLLTLNLTNNVTREQSQYNFLTQSYSTVSINSLLSFTFSDDWRLQGLSYVCKGDNWTFSTAGSAANSNITTDVLSCTSPKTNRIVVDVSTGSLGINTTLVDYTFKNIVNPNNPGFPNDISAKLYSPAYQVIWSKSYPNLSQGSVTQVVSRGFHLIAPEALKLVAGTSAVVTITTPSYHEPARFNLTIVGKSSYSSLKLAQANNTIAQGDYSTQFILEAGLNSVPGVYYIYWTLSGPQSPLLYENLPTLEVTIVTDVVAVSFDPVPELKTNATSFPLGVYLDLPPEANLTVSITSALSTVAIAPKVLTFQPGQTEAYYQISTGNNSNVWDTLTFALSGSDATAYWVSEPELGFSIGDANDTQPTLIWLQLHNPIQLHSATFTVKSDFPAFFYILLVYSGATAPSQSDIVGNSLYVVTDPLSLTADFTLDNLTPHTNYDLYGVLVSENQVFSSIHMMTFTTAVKMNTVEFYMQLSGSAPSDTELALHLQPWVARVLGVSLCRLQITSVSRNSPSVGAHKVTFRLFGTDDGTLQSPQETIESLASEKYLNGALQSYFVQNFSSNWVEISRTVPDWIQYPRLFNGNSSMVQVIFTPLLDGTVYAAVLSKNFSLPAATDVKWGRARDGTKATYSALQHVTGGAVSVLSLQGLAPNSDAVIYLVLQNDRVDSEELTDPYPLVVPQYIFTYLNEVTEDATGLGFVLALILSLNLL